jgi:hypothetical protein
MAKRAVDLSLEELAAMGAAAAHQAVHDARKAGLTITGTIDTYEGTHRASSLAQLMPSGTVTLVVEDETAEPAKDEPLRPSRDKDRIVD